MGIRSLGMATCTAVTASAEDSQRVPCFTPAAGWELELLPAKVTPLRPRDVGPDSTESLMIRQCL